MILHVRVLRYWTDRPLTQIFIRFSGFSRSLVSLHIAYFRLSLLVT